MEAAIKEITFRERLVLPFEDDSHPRRSRRHTGLAKSLSEQVLPGYASATQAIHAASFATPPDLYPAAPVRERSKTPRPMRGKSITEDHLDGSIRNLRASIQSCQPKEEPTP